MSSRSFLVAVNEAGLGGMMTLGVDFNFGKGTRILPALNFGVAAGVCLVFLLRRIPGTTVIC